MIRRRSPLPRLQRQPKKASRKPDGGNEDIAAAVAIINQLEGSSPKAEAVLSLLKTWLNDRSGYDEVAWPQLKKGLDRERQRQGARRLFDGYQQPLQPR